MIDDNRVVQRPHEIYISSVPADVRNVQVKCLTVAADLVDLSDLRNERLLLP